MKILHIVEDFSVGSGGLRTVIKNLDFYLKSIGFDSFILSSKKEYEDEIFIVNSRNKWLYSKKWVNEIDNIVKHYNIDVIHIHGVWLYPQLVGAKYAIVNKKPLVLSAHGMYQPWLWKKGTLKKKIYFNLLSKKWFSKATLIHTITANETKSIKYFLNNKEIVEIPNLITVVERNEKYQSSEKYILYLGRLNKSKGIDLLIRAFAQVNNQNIKFKIAGEFNKYKKELESLINSLNLANKVEFLSLVKNEQKKELIRNSWVMVAPTYSDVIGMVNLEAASLRTPIITTYNTGLDSGWNKNGGKLINPNVEELKTALDEVLKWTIEERNLYGQKLFNFVKDHYSWESRLIDWRNLYEKAVNHD